MTNTELKILQEQFKSHCVEDKRAHKSLIDMFKSLSGKVTLIKDNHLEHLSKDVAELKVNMDWVKKIQWAMVSGIVGNLIGIIYLIIK